METKRCAYCRKLQRAESRMCSRCGRSFERRRSRSGGRSWNGSVSLFSLPVASPHHVGHYSGLHPEDQPYQSNVIITPQYAMQHAQGKKPLQQGSKPIVLPTVQHAPVVDGYHDISQALAQRQVPFRRSRLYPVTDQSLPGSLETDSTGGGNGQTQPISRPFMREVLPATQRLQLIEEVTLNTYGREPELSGIQQLQKTQSVDDWDSAPPLEDEPFALTNDGTPLPEDLPWYMQETLPTRKKRWSSRIISTVVLTSSFCILLVTSIMVLAWMGSNPANRRPLSPVAPLTAEAQTKGSSSEVQKKGLPSRLQLSDTQIVFDSAAADIVSSRTVTLKNIGGDKVVWAGSSDQIWLTVSPKSGTFAERDNIQITVNRGGMAPGDYSGRVTFVQQGQESSPSLLSVTMTVAPLPAQLSVSTTSLSYSTAQSQIPESQVITIRNTGEQALNWDATVATQDEASWLTLSLLHGVLPAGGSQSLIVQVVSQTLPMGTYTGSILFTGDADAQVRVSLTVIAPSNLTISPSSLSFNSTQLADQILTLRNNGDVSLNWRVKPLTNGPVNWLSVTTASGMLGPGESVTITVRVDPSNLLPGTYQGKLMFSFGDQTERVSVSFVVAGATPTSWFSG